MTALPGLVLFAVAMSGTPGPNNVMVTASGATFGLRRTMPHVLGISVGFPVMILMIGLGLGPVLIANPAVHRGFKWLGIAYMVWLAARIATARRPDAKGANRRSRPLSFLEAALFQWVNPKAWVIAAAAMSTFVSLADNLWVQTGMIVIVFLLVTLPVVSAWAGIGSGIGSVLRSDRQFRAFNLAMAALLVLSIVSLFFER
ncbi:LysE family translocator [Acidiphilium sp. AL]|uniref:LysE family translocator n=1 Tax=Acidiphilium sp. AL TaxID=2871704 RepID=UPI0021CB1655|nr:LysE family translocator [Acidiphilium sp. AL]MCU4158860.1 LysE family translocator [Acidiphilium sp. AL]